jgi:hypothetical protein
LGIEPPPAYRQILERVTRSAGIHGKMPVVMIERRLQPYDDELYEWAFQRFAQQCKQRGIHPLVVYRPPTLDFDGSEQPERTKVIGLARAAGLEVIDLSPAFDSVTNRNTLIIANGTITLRHLVTGCLRISCTKDSCQSSLFRPTNILIGGRAFRPHNARKYEPRFAK